MGQPHDHRTPHQSSNQEGRLVPRKIHTDDDPLDFKVVKGTISWCNRCDKDVEHIILIEDPVFLCTDCFAIVSSKHAVTPITPEVWDIVQKALKDAEEAAKRGKHG
jgi:hypothetical protein